MRAARRIKHLAKKEHKRQKVELVAYRSDAERATLFYEAREFIIEELAMRREFSHLARKLSTDGAANFLTTMHLNGYASPWSSSEYEIIAAGAARARMSWMHALSVFTDEMFLHDKPRKS